MRAFARRLSVSSGALSEILSGKRKPSKEFARAVISRMDLSSADQRALLQKIDSPSDREERDVSAHAEALLSKWYYIPVFYLFETQVPPKSAGDVAAAFGLTPAEAENAIRVLREAGALVEQGGKLEAATGVGFSFEAVDPAVLRRFHARHLSRLLERTLSSDSPEGVLETVTFAGTTEEIAKARNEIRRFCRRLAERYSRANASDVLTIGAVLVPSSVSPGSTPRR